MQLVPNMMVSAWLSSSMRPSVGSDVGLLLAFAVAGQQMLDTILERWRQHWAGPCANKLTTCLVTGVKL